MVAWGDLDAEFKPPPGGPPVPWQPCCDPNSHFLAIWRELVALTFARKYVQQSA